MPDPKRPTKSFPCPCCGAPLFRMHIDDGSRTSDSAALVEDDDGMHSVCSGCHRKIRMEGPAGVWIPARQQDCD